MPYFTVDPYIIQVYDGVPSDANELELLRRFCGSSTPMSLRSSTNVLYVEFKSDVEDTFTGFNATYMHFKGIFNLHIRGIFSGHMMSE